MKLTAMEQAQHGYTITEMTVVGGGKTYGLVWYDTGEHNCGWPTAEAAETFAERWYSYHYAKDNKGRGPNTALCVKVSHE